MIEPRLSICPGCGQKNRVRIAATGVPHCAKCGRALPWLGEVAAADFDAAVRQSPVPVLIDFWAPWCGPCRMVAPTVERLSADLAGRLKVAKVNTDEEPGLGNSFSVRGIPTLLLMDQGREVDRLVGAASPTQLRKLGREQAAGGQAGRPMIRANRGRRETCCGARSI